METISGNEKWALEVYDEIFDPANPSPDQKKKVTILVNSLQGNSLYKQKIKKSFNKLLGTTTKIETVIPSEAGFGITYISLNREKESVASSCSIKTVGSLPQNIAVGTWVVLSSFSDLANQSGTTLGVIGAAGAAAQGPGIEGTTKFSSGFPIPRFIGQIEMISNQYTVTPDGTLVKNTNILIREWSKVLDTPLRFDSLSIKYHIYKKGNSAVASKNLVSPSGDWAKFLSESYDPVQFVHTILAIYNSVNKTDVISSAKNFLVGASVKNNNSFVSVPPQVPKALLIRLGLTKPLEVIEPGDHTGFSNFITNVYGITKTDWSKKVGGNGGVQSIVAYKNSTQAFYDTRALRTKSVATAIKSIGLSMTGWGAIQSSGEKHIYEHFSDIWYQENKGGVRAMPVFVSRDKPFTLKHILETPSYQKIAFDTISNLIGKKEGVAKVGKFVENIKSNWSLFDYIPTIVTKRASVKGFNVVSNSNSPNQFIPRVRSSFLKESFSKTYGAIHGRVIQPDLMRKFGAQEYAYDCQYWIDNSTAGTAGTNKAVIETYANLLSLWHSFTYLMPTGILSIKDPDLNISVGFNIKFSVGFFNIVGQVKSYTSTYTVEPDGTEISNTSLEVERCVIEVFVDPKKSKKTKLIPMPLGGWSKLTDKKFASAQLSSSKTLKVLAP